jgi:4-carboxymuconolactone decarboxylase
MTKTVRERGEEMFNKVYGGIVPLPQDQDNTFVNHTLDHLFAEVWSRNVLSVKERRLLAIGAIAALGESATFEIQMKAAIAKGELTPEQVKEILIFIVYYVGYPRAAGLHAALARALASAADSSRG